MIEKNSDVRHVAMTLNTEEALLCYIKFTNFAKQSGPVQCLFPSSQFFSQPCMALCCHTLRNLCTRGGIAHFYPHQFRSYIFNSWIEQGYGIDVASKWLGHRNPLITYQWYYYTPETATVPWAELIYPHKNPHSGTGTAGMRAVVEYVFKYMSSQVIPHTMIVR